MMLREYTPLALLACWKRRLGLAPLAGGKMDAGEKDLTEVDRKLLDDIDLWYASLLEIAPVEMLPMADFSSTVIARPFCERGVEVQLPDEGIRLVEVKLKSWERGMTEFSKPGSDADILQFDPRTRACVASPVGVLFPGRLELFGASDGDKVERLVMVRRPATGNYVFNPLLMDRYDLLIH